MRYAKYLLIASLASCSTTDHVSQPNGIWHESDLLDEFVDQWAVCGHFFAMTADKQWLLRVDVSSRPGTYDEHELVSLLNFSKFSNRDDAISLFRDNDIATDIREPLLVPAFEGDGRIQITNRVPDWESTMKLDFQNLVFQYEDSEIYIKRVFFEDFPKPNWCPG